VKTLRRNLARAVVLLVVAAVVVGGALYVFDGGDTKTVTARFTSAVGVYTGTPVRQLGVNIGEVTSVKPKGAYVEVRMEYEDTYSLPADATAVEVANSLVSDRFIQLSAYKGSGPTMASGAKIPMARTAAPAELDDIYKALNTLSVALGPNGANKNGALSTLLKVGSANLKGNGAALGQSISNLSRAAKTLSDGRKDLFGTVTNLRKFTGALAQSDGQVRKFNTQLAQVAGSLADERTDLGAALKQLGLTLDKVNGFVKKNAGKLHEDISGLREITGVLVKQKASLNETVTLAPVALANIVHAYQPDLGVLPTRSNLNSLVDPGQVCVVVHVLTQQVTELLPDALQNFLGPLTGTIVSTCETLVKQKPALLAGGALTSALQAVEPILNSLGALGRVVGG
jgi:phospholipid/cholesterol/gamma-HCH transport system substrate-binding protein